MSRCFKVDDVLAETVLASTTSGLQASWLLDWGSAKGTGAVNTEAERTRITCQVYKPGGNHAPHEHESIEQTYYILSGTGRVHIAGEEWDVGPGTMAFIPAKVRHFIENTGNSDLVHLLVNVNLGAGRPD